MNWIAKVVSIKEKLTQHGFIERVAKINRALLVLGTPGEMYLEVMAQLVAIKNESPKEFELIENEVNELIEYGRSINYYD
jgi:hypothetical protein